MLSNILNTFLFIVSVVVMSSCCGFISLPAKKRKYVAVLVSIAQPSVVVHDQVLLLNYMHKILFPCCLLLFRANMLLLNYAIVKKIESTSQCLLQLLIPVLSFMIKDTTYAKLLVHSLVSHFTFAHSPISSHFHFLCLHLFLFSQDNFTDQEIEVHEWAFTDSAHP